MVPVGGRRVELAMGWEDVAVVVGGMLEMVTVALQWTYSRQTESE
jgi:hypothetical protein